MSSELKIHRNGYELWLALGLILVVSALAYLPLVGQLGYYHDDWFTTASRISGVSLRTMHEVDRPGMGVLYQAVANLLGEAPLAWHLFAWAARAGGALALFWLARLLWPGQKLAAVLMALLYAVYPGFLQQPSANNYQNHLLAYLASILSLALTVQAVRSSGWLARIILSLAALALAYGYPRVYEAMIGMEGLRFILIWYVSGLREMRAWWKRLAASLIWFAPFLLNAAYFVYWRLFQFVSLRVSVNAESLLEKYRGNFTGIAISVVANVIKDAFETVVAAWVVPIYQLGLGVRIRYLFIGFLLAAIVFLLVIIIARRIGGEPGEQPAADLRWAKEAAIIGGLGVIITLLPVGLSGRDVQFRNYFDRYTLQSMVPAVMFLVGAVWLSFQPRVRAGAAAALAALAIFTHLFNAAYYAANWEMQRQVWWQLSWRAPQIQPGTALIVQMPAGFQYPEGFEIWAPANRIYYPDEKGPRITAEVLNRETLPVILAGTQIERNFRWIEYTDDFRNMLVLSMPSESSCLHVVNGPFEMSNWDLDITREAARVSQPERIDPNGEGHTPPRVIFGSEPAHEWCYYYQKADLARQRGDWQEVVRLGEEAERNGYFPADPVEWTPFFEANIHLGQIAEAQKLAVLIAETPSVAESLCVKYLPLSTSFGRDASRLLCGIQ